MEYQIAPVFTFKQFKAGVELLHSSGLLVTIYQFERRNLDSKHYVYLWSSFILQTSFQVLLLVFSISFLFPFCSCCYVLLNHLKKLRYRFVFSVLMYSNCTPPNIFVFKQIMFTLIAATLLISANFIAMIIKISIIHVVR